MKKMLAMIHARNMEFFRDKGTLFWNILFPFFLVFGFAFAFSGNSETTYKVGIYGTPQKQMEILSMDYIEFIEYGTAEKAVEKVRHQQIDMFLDFNSSSYYISKESTSGYFLEQLLKTGAGDTVHEGQQSGAAAASDGKSNSDAGGKASATQRAGLERKTIAGRPIRYVDKLVPGVIGMNMMFSSLFGVGFVIVRYRKNGVLKRLKATPVRAVEFVSSQVLSRLFIVLAMSIFVYVGSNIFLNFLMLGSYLNLILTALLSILCLISFGLIFAARIKSEELASGVMNIALWPMIVFSGVFFSLEGTPEIIQRISLIFPLTHFIDAARSIMLDGAGFMEIAPNLLTLVGMTGVFLLIASALFKWE